MQRLSEFFQEKKTVSASVSGTAGGRDWVFWKKSVQLKMKRYQDLCKVLKKATTNR
jgi:hypothetical protein